MKVNLSEIEKRIEKGLINKQKHPEFPLWIYNYSKTCQFGRDWDEYTLMCRGLILDEEGNIVARPFPKFFNVGELESVGQKLPNKAPIRVEKKYDGSLGISYFWEGKMYLTTRGSFTSEQAIMGTKILHEKYGKTAVSSKKTYLFEIIYPENRIVIDYGDKKDLVLLAVKDIEEGFESIAELSGFNYRETIPVRDIEALRALESPNEEGFVLVYEDGFRTKIKFDEYVRLHRIMTGVNARRVWDVLRNGDNLDDYLKGVPEEFENWITGVRDDLLSQYKDIEDRAKNIYGQLPLDASRKDQAAIIMATDKEVSGIVFSLLDGKDYSQTIWKMLKPEATDPFKVEV